MLINFFSIFTKNLIINTYMSKRYNGKSFKDSSVKKKPKMSLKERRKIKKEKQKKQINHKFC